MIATTNWYVSSCVASSSFLPCDDWNQPAVPSRSSSLLHLTHFRKFPRLNNESLRSLSLNGNLNSLKERPVWNFILQKCKSFWLGISRYYNRVLLCGESVSNRAKWESNISVNRFINENHSYVPISIVCLWHGRINNFRCCCMLLWCFFFSVNLITPMNTKSIISSRLTCVRTIASTWHTHTPIHLVGDIIYLTFINILSSIWCLVLSDMCLWFHKLLANEKRRKTNSARENDTSFKWNNTQCRLTHIYVAF